MVYDLLLESRTRHCQTACRETHKVYSFTPVFAISQITLYHHKNKRNVNGNPEIYARDHPCTIYRALLGGLSLYGVSQDPTVTERWTKISADARGAIQDGFGLQDPDTEMLNPEGSARLYVSIDELKTILVGYGNVILEMGDEEELARVDELLQSADNL